jgi:hypothetical protein
MNLLILNKILQIIYGFRVWTILIQSELILEKEKKEKLILIVSLPHKIAELIFDFLSTLLYYNSEKIL